MPEQFGVLYVATGDSCVVEANRSASSIKALMPDLPLAIFTDKPSSMPPGLFNHVFLISDPTYSSYDKIEPLAKTPFARTLFLDSDTLVIETVYELRDLLDRFEFAYCHAPVRFEENDFPGCNEAFPQGNSGVILYKRGPRMRKLFLAWAELYRAQRESFRLSGFTGRMLDQPSFRQVVYSSDLRFTILPSEYNLRTAMPYFAGGRARVKILHGRDPELTAASRLVNDNLRPRTGKIRISKI